ncbi:MAG: 50S ribosomal protein L34e [Candidatus Hadarchaeum sp.]|uniref:50S ribosomal protein L34e n=1 Tax=Candidatus Hadarchaeum sp. TaxID=2883567 RepID=UPI003D140B8D
MPARRYRSGTYKERQVHTPGGRVSRQYRERRKSAAACAFCGQPLSGVPRKNRGRMGSLPRSLRMPNRPFGGYFCAACSRRALIEKVRA